MKKNPQISVVIPCLNEEKTIGRCVREAKNTFKMYRMNGEVIVVDNDSEDQSAKKAKEAGAKVIFEKRRGYGSAYLRGLEKARGNFLVMADGDGTYDFTEMIKFIKLLENGFDFVCGNRLKGKMAKGTMPWVHRYIGVPLLTSILNFLFKIKVADAHCGMRAFTKKAYQEMDLRTLGMEFASEMIVKASMVNLKIAEVPISYRPREGESKLRTFRDGWRHLRFMLFYSPNVLFLVPGLLFFGLGAGIILLLLPGRFFVGQVSLDVHTMQLGSLLTIFGFQIINLGFYARVYAHLEGIGFSDRLIESFLKGFNLEKALVGGLAIFLVGISLYFWVFFRWASVGFGELSQMRGVIVATTLTVIGAQVMFSGFFISSVLIPKKDR